MSSQPYGLFSVTLKQRIPLSPSLVRLVFTGEQVASMTTFAPDQRIKIFFPHGDGSPPALPEQGDWYAAFKALPPERRPPMRTYTIRWLDAARAEVTVDFVLHGDAGPASAWAIRARPGDPVQMAAPNRHWPGPVGGFEWCPPEQVSRVLLMADETALPAVAGILEELADRPRPPHVDAYLEVPLEADRLTLRAPVGARLNWLPRQEEGARAGERLQQALEYAELPKGEAGETVAEIPDEDDGRLWDTASAADGAFYAWVAGETSAVLAIRRRLVKERGLSRRSLALMGYWRQGKSLE